MKKIIIAIAVLILTNALLFANAFKKHIVTTWIYETNGRKVEITFRDDNSFKYLEKQARDGKYKPIHNLDGDYKLKGRYITLNFSDKKNLRLTILQIFFGANTTNYIIKDDFGRTYQEEKPKVEVKKGKEAQKANAKENNGKDVPSSNEPANNKAETNQ